eukprot:Rhum_TRINITY_DN14334_c9_g1::Rhum_TRINITY_DN14334_c9_g1_i2::g.81999::m.81999
MNGHSSRLLRHAAESRHLFRQSVVARLQLLQLLLKLLHERALCRCCGSSCGYGLNAAGLLCSNSPDPAPSVRLVRLRLMLVLRRLVRLLLLRLLRRLLLLLLLLLRRRSVRFGDLGRNGFLRQIGERQPLLLTEELAVADLTGGQTHLLQHLHEGLVVVLVQRQEHRNTGARADDQAGGRHVVVRHLHVAVRDPLQDTRAVRHGESLVLQGNLALAHALPVAVLPVPPRPHGQHVAPAAADAAAVLATLRRRRRRGGGGGARRLLGALLRLAVEAGGTGGGGAEALVEVEDPGGTVHRGLLRHELAPLKPLPRLQDGRGAGAPGASHHRDLTRAFLSGH